MIQDVDDTLKALLIHKVPIDLAAIDISFEAPTKGWSSGVSRPTLNLFLYDIRENHELRSNQRHRDVSGPARVRIDLCYMITAWTADVSDEHQLLGRVLTTLLQFPSLPADVLRGSMTSQPFALRAWIAQTERTLNPWDFWGNVEHHMKVALNFVLTVALQPFPDGDMQLAGEGTFAIGEIN